MEDLFEIKCIKDIYGADGIKAFKEGKIYHAFRNMVDEIIAFNELDEYHTVSEDDINDEDELFDEWFIEHFEVIEELL